MKKIHIISLLFMYASTCFFTIPQVSATTSSIGVSPSQIENNLLVPGSVYSAELTVSRATADEEVIAKVETTSDNITSWMSFPSGNTIILAKGVQRGVVKVTIKVPSDAKIGTYKGSFRFSLIKEEQGQVNIIPGVRVDIKLDVIDAKIESFIVKYVKIVNTPYGAPYSLLVKIDNTGNVEIAPDELTLTVFDLSENQLRKLTYKFEEKVAAFQSKELQLSVPNITSLPIGEYIGSVSMTYRGKTIYSEKIMFRVTDAVPLATTSIPVGEVKQKESLLFFVVLFLILLFIASGLGIFFVYAKKDGKKRATTL